MIFVLLQYLWPQVAPCLSAACAAFGLTSLVAPTKTRRTRGGRRRSSSGGSWTAQWDEEACDLPHPACELVDRERPVHQKSGAWLLSERTSGVSPLCAKETADRLQLRLHGPFGRLTQAQQPQVPLCVGFELQLAAEFCRLAGVDTQADQAFVKTLLKTLQLLHCCGYSWEMTLMTLSVGLVYADTCASTRRSGLLEETWSCAESDSESDCSTNPCMSTYACENGSFQVEERSALAQKRVLCLLFLAHCYLVDDPCFLCTWNKYVFAGQDLEELNLELMGLFKGRGYNLKVDSNVVLPLYQRLEATVRSHPAGKDFDLAGSEDAPA